MVENLRKEFAKRGKQKRKGCKKIQGEEKVKVVVRNTSFAVESGEVLGLLGPNGAGKTTTLNMVIAEVGPTKGKVRYCCHYSRMIHLFHMSCHQINYFHKNFLRARYILNVHLLVYNNTLELK